MTFIPGKKKSTKMAKNPVSLPLNPNKYCSFIIFSVLLIQKNKENFPIRGQTVEEEEEVPKSNSEENKNGNAADRNQNLIRDQSSIPDYYREWDKLAANVVTLYNPNEFCA